MDKFSLIRHQSDMENERRKFIDISLITKVKIASKR